MNDSSNSDRNHQPPHPADLRARREKLGLTRAALAVQARCSLTAIANIETGVTRRGISIRRVTLILDELENQAA